MLVDPGPESSVSTVLEAIGDERPRALLLTHIHLDHAAATGALVRRWPELEVYVHERGAPHLIDPAKLLASAERLYGDRLGYLWGEILPVPEENVRVLSGGEAVLGMRVAYTPGHASHHVCYFHEETGTAFVGDLAAWSPQRLALTHFGAIEEDVPAYIESVKAKLREEADLARRMDEAAYNADLEARIRAELASEGIAGDTVEEMLQAVPTAYQWAGLDRYWRKKAEREAVA